MGGSLGGWGGGYGGWGGVGGGCGWGGGPGEGGKTERPGHEKFSGWSGGKKVVDTDTLPATGSEKTIHIHLLGPCPNARHLHTKLLEQAGGGGRVTGRLRAHGFRLGCSASAGVWVVGAYIAASTWSRGGGHKSGVHNGGAFEWVCLKLLLDRMARSPNESGRGQLRGGRVSFELVDTIFLPQTGTIYFFENEVVVKYHMRRGDQTPRLGTKSFQGLP